MADLLFGDLGLILVPKRKERQFRLHDDFSLTDFTDSELRSRYRFGHESIEFFGGASSWRSWKTYVAKPCLVNHCASSWGVALFCQWKLSPSYWRYSRPVKVYRLTHCQQSLLCPFTKTSTLHQVAIDGSRDCSNDGNEAFMTKEGSLAWLAVLTARTSRFKDQPKMKMTTSTEMGFTQLTCKRFAITKVCKNGIQQI